MLKFLLKQFHKTSLSFRLLYLSSQLLSYLFRENRVAKLPRFNSFQMIEGSLDALVWNPDEFFVLDQRTPSFWIRTAEEIQWFLDHRLSPTAEMGCIAAYAAEALESLEEAIHPCILTVKWIDSSGVVKGHTTALYSYNVYGWKRLYGHMGNWGHFRGFNSAAQVAKSIAETMGGKILSYALASPSLGMRFHEQVG